jgi:hypothetical protein
MSILRGYEEAIARTALQFTADIEIKPRFGGLLTSPASYAKTARSTGHVADVDYVLSREALVRSSNGIDGVMLVWDVARTHQQTDGAADRPWRIRHSHE